MTLETYLEQFRGDEPDSTYIIETDEDMERFERLMRFKWADEHGDVIREWEANQDGKCPDCEAIEKRHD